MTLHKIYSTADRDRKWIRLERSEGSNSWFGYHRDEVGATFEIVLTIFTDDDDIVVEYDIENRALRILYAETTEIGYTLRGNRFVSESVTEILPPRTEAGI
jgi:hypothetical protein